MQNDPITVCPGCGESFPSWRNQKWCSYRCKERFRGKEQTCDRCGRIFLGRVKNTTRRYCSVSCHSDDMRTGHNKRGYILIRFGGRKQAHEHRLIAEQTIGRALLPTEDVHHINGDTTDNRPENLQVMTRTEHMRLTALERYRRGDHFGFGSGADNPKYKPR